MRIRILHHADESAFARGVREEIERRGFEPVEGPGEADVGLVLVGRGALRDGLGTGLRDALEQGLALVPVLVGADAVPPGLPVAKKHLPLASDAAVAVRHVVERMAEGQAGRLDGKKELLGQGLLIALVARGS